MSTFAIDLGAPFYWVFLAIAVIIMTSIAQRGRRVITLAMLDLLFISLLTSIWGGVAAAGFAFVVHRAATLAQSSDDPTRRRSALALGAAVVLGLFLLHKLGGPSAGQLVRGPAGRVLAAIGFSYVALRSVELLRAGADRVVASTSWLDAVTYLFPFHMLAAGPIQSWDEFCRQPKVTQSLSVDEVLEAVDRIVRGLFKKFVLARSIEVMLLTNFNASWQYQIIEVQAYYLWVYLDFSAYSDLAVGAGRLLGVATPENFRRPLGARNIIQFWERWHMSLSAFVRRNLFIPVQLTLMRRSDGAHALRAASTAFAVSFILVGLWHEVSPRFVLWGAMHALALILCNMYRHAMVARVGREGMVSYMSNPVYRAVAMLITFEFVAFSLAFIVHPATAFLD